MFLKIFLAIFCYLFFTIYTVPVFKNVKASATENIFLNRKTLTIGNTILMIEIADTQEKRIQGLSGQKKLAQDTGMLFVFDTPDKHGIWMKDMNFSIDIIWFDSNGEIVHIVEQASPESYSSNMSLLEQSSPSPVIFTPPKNSSFVLEVPAGFVQMEGVKIGDKIDLI